MDAFQVNKSKVDSSENKEPPSSKKIAIMHIFEEERGQLWLWLAKRKKMVNWPH